METTAAKSSKAARGGKDPKRRELAAEIAALRADVDVLKEALKERTRPIPAPVATERSALEEQLQATLNGSADAAVVYAFACRTDGGVAAGSGEVRGLESLLRGGDERVARLGYALASLPKVGLLRALLLDGPQSAAHLGEKAGLSTGSLYHHLRELMHADVVQQTARNQYALTALGQHAVLLLFALAGSEPR